MRARDLRRARRLLAGAHRRRPRVRFGHVAHRRRRDAPRRAELGGRRLFAIEAIAGGKSARSSRPPGRRRAAGGRGRRGAARGARRARRTAEAVPRTRAVRRGESRALVELNQLRRRRRTTKTSASAKRTTTGPSPGERAPPTTQPHPPLPPALTMSPPAPDAAMSFGMHAPATHVPLPSEQAVPSAAFAGAGHTPELPVQLAPRLHGPVGARHCVLAATNMHEAEQQEPGVPFAPG